MFLTKRKDKALKSTPCVSTSHQRVIIEYFLFLRPKKKEKMVQCDDGARCCDPCQSEPVNYPEDLKVAVSNRPYVKYPPTPLK